VRELLTNEKYIGNNIFNRTSFKLQKKRVTNPPDMWVRAVGVFPAIVDKDLFAAAQTIMAERYQRLSDGEMLERLNGLYERRGLLSSLIIDEAGDVPSSTTYRRPCRPSPPPSTTPTAVRRRRAGEDGAGRCAGARRSPRRRPTDAVGNIGPAAREAGRHRCCRIAARFVESRGPASMASRRSRHRHWSCRSGMARREAGRFAPFGPRRGVGRSLRAANWKLLIRGLTNGHNFDVWLN
jgi:hypothetical protein